MVFNSSRLPDKWCSSLTLNATRITSVYYQVTLTTCVVTLLLAPMAVVGNALIMAAIWKNPSLRTPSYVLLAGLAFTDFCAGLLSQPVFVVNHLARLVGERKMYCFAHVITEIVAYYFSSLTGIFMTIMAVERWLHMSRRSLLTVRRVVILCIVSAVLLIAFFACRTYNWFYPVTSVGPFSLIIVSGAALCFALTLFAYFKVFRIIRHHQSHVQPNQNSIDVVKYKKSVFTILYIVAIFLLSYIPYVCCLLVAIFLNKFRSTVAFNVCAAIVFSSSFANPLLYYWRIKDIRNVIRNMVKNLFCSENGES